MPRMVDGKPVDWGLTMRFAFIQEYLTEYIPNTAEKMFNKVAKGLQDKSFNLRPEWNFEPAPSLKQSVQAESNAHLS